MNRLTNGEDSATAAPEASHSQPEKRASGWRGSKWLAVAELVVVALIFYADFKHLIFFSKTPYLALFAWLSLRARQLRWRDVGLSIFRNWKTTLALAVAAGILMEAFELFVSQPLLVKLLGKNPDLEDFRPLIGNLKLTLSFIVL